MSSNRQKILKHLCIAVLVSMPSSRRRLGWNMSMRMHICTGHMCTYTRPPYRATTVGIHSLFRGSPSKDECTEDLSPPRMLAFWSQADKNVKNACKAGIQSTFVQSWTVLL